MANAIYVGVILTILVIGPVGLALYKKWISHEAAVIGAIVIALLLAVADAVLRT